MSRPKRHDPRQQILLRMDPALYQRLKGAAADRELSMNWLIVRAVEEFLDHLIPADELRLTRTARTQEENEHG
mgnify:FL=1|jgi:hypothetical protein